jgi:hypothetical protein
VCEVVTPQSTWSPPPPELTCVDLNCVVDPRAPPPPPPRPRAAPPPPPPPRPVDPNACTAVGGTCVDNCGNGQGTNCADACWAQNGQADFPWPVGDCLVRPPTTPSPNCCNAAQMGGNLCAGTQVCCLCDRGA